MWPSSSVPAGPSQILHWAVRPDVRTTPWPPWPDWLPTTGRSELRLRVRAGPFPRQRRRLYYEFVRSLPCRAQVRFPVSRSGELQMPTDVSPAFGSSTPRYRRTIRRPELRRIVPLADTTIYELEQRGEFPRRFNLTPRCVVWDLAEVEAWIDERRRASDASLIARSPSPDVRQRRSRPVRQ